MDIKYLDSFETKLQDDLLRLCTSNKMLEGTLLTSDDIKDQWHQKLAPEYVADAVEQVQAYPIVSVAWAAYLGMAVACAWDTDWATFSKAPYQAFYGDQGFDDMDEHIVKDLLEIPLDSEEAQELEAMIRRCGQAAVSHIRHEDVEPQSPVAFHLFARAAKVMFLTGAALELKRLGYKFEKMELPH